jgi:hypothetical protein
MIVFDLKCKDGHVFEAWFKDSAAFTAHTKARKVACPFCGSKKVAKAPMAPRLGSGAQAPVAAAVPAAPPPPPDPKMVEQVKFMKALGELRRHVEQNCEHVGTNFAEEARKIHYNETPARNIYGEATAKEAKELHEEGVEFGAIPWPQTPDA